MGNSTWPWPRARPSSPSRCRSQLVWRPLPRARPARRFADRCSPMAAATPIFFAACGPADLRPGRDLLVIRLAQELEPHTMEPQVLAGVADGDPAIVGCRRGGERGFQIHQMD